jgi:hypothetical protein
MAGGLRRRASLRPVSRMNRGRYLGRGPSPLQNHFGRVDTDGPDSIVTLRLFEGSCKRADPDTTCNGLQRWA